MDEAIVVGRAVFFSSRIFMKACFRLFPRRGVCRVLACLLLLGQCLRADIEADYDALTAGVQGQSTSLVPATGSVAMFGKAAFPVLLGPGNYQLSAMSAGRYDDRYDAGAARAVVYAYMDYYSTTGAVNSSLFANATLWASRKAVPAGTTVANGTSYVVNTVFTNLGYTARSVGTNLSASDLSGVDVLVLDMNRGYTASAITNIRNFTAAGGGIVMYARALTLGAQGAADAGAILEPFGLALNMIEGRSTYGAIPATSYSPYYSALNATDDLIRDKEGALTMTSTDKLVGANAVDQVLAVRHDIAPLNAALDVLSDDAHYGLITPTAAAPVARATKPVEALLARYQSIKFDEMTPAQLFAHPSASDFPGLPAAGSTVSRTISVNGNTAPDAYMNRGDKPVRFETGLYAAPGATIAVTIPSSKTTAGLLVHIAGNGSGDETWKYNEWTFFPKLWRRVPLTTSTTQTGNVFGGLVTILVPPGSSLGTFDVTVSGALPAPAFTLGQNTDAEWNATLKHHPAPYGFLKTDKITLYVPKSQLMRMDNPEAVAAYWKKVMDIADEYYGYTPWRKRGEAIASSRYVSAGGAYAGYPIEAGWGVTDDAFLNNARINGSWGNYHELGHGYQDNFDGAFGIATHAEIDVNLMPGMVYTFVHDKTTWEYASNFYGSAHRLTHRNGFLALSSAQQTWAAACENNSDHGAAYDFYYNLSDAFGWQAYKAAFGRLMNYLQNPAGSTDTALKNLSSSDPNFKRNRFYLLMCDATGRNLDTYFQRYGLGAVGKGYEITQSVKDLVAAKGYPVWTDNTAVDTLTNPGALSVSEAIAPGAEIYQFAATDAEEPGTIWDYQITAGNANGAFSIDKRTGKLRAQKLDAETTTSYNLTVTVQDNGVPRFAKTSIFTVNVQNATEAPKVDGKLFTANAAMANGTSLGNVTAALEPGRSIASYEIVAGNAANFAVTPAGAIIVSNAASLPNPGMIALTIKVMDDTGLAGFGIVNVLCNSTTGIYEERWPTQEMSGNSSVTGIRSSFNMLTNVGSNYVRKVSGWVVPPKSGSYTFWIASDDESSLFLSNDHTSTNKEWIASAPDNTGAMEWAKFTSQQSSYVILEAGRPYYIEAIHYEHSGGDHLAVAWSGPGISQQVIPGANLIPNVTNLSVSVPSGQAPTVTLVANDANAAEQGSNSGSFTLTRTGDTTAALTVRLARGGTATNGSDYQSIATSVTIPAGAASTTVTVTPTADSLAEGNETLTLALQSDVLYMLGSPSAATVTIADTPVDNWRVTNFGSDANTPSLAGDGADFDGDGLKNLAEYAMGKNPKVANAPQAPANESGMLSLTYTRNLAATDVTLTPQWSDDLGAWNTSSITEEILSEVGNIRTVKAKVAIGANPKKFLRMQATRP